MTTYETSIAIPRPIEEVYTLISDPNRATEWITGLIKVELTKGRFNEVGSQMKYTFEENGRVIEFTEELLSVEPNSHFSFRIDSKYVEMETETHLKTIGENKTEVMMSNAVSGKGLMMKVMIPLSKKVMKKRQQQDLERLKAILLQDDEG